MASPHVRQWFIDKITELVGSDAPFQETDGALLQKKGLPELWTTLETDIGSTQNLTIGSPSYIEREYGTVTVMFLLKAGKGPKAALALAQSFRDNMVAQYQDNVQEESGIVGTIRLENVGPPNSEGYEDGNWLVCSVACVYTYDSVRQRATQG